MKKSRYTEEQISYALRQAETGTPVAEVIHGVLAAVRFDIAIPDRFGKLVHPREWFLVPLPVIDEIVARVGDGSLVGMRYDPKIAALSMAD